MPTCQMDFNEQYIVAHMVGFKLKLCHNAPTQVVRLCLHVWGELVYLNISTYEF